MRPFATMRRGRAARGAAPLLALAAILVHLGGTVGGYLHFALVAHEKCPEHGELVHAQPGGEGHGAHAAPRPDGRRTLDSVERSDRRSEESHDACELTAALRERVVEPGSSSSGRADLPPSRRAPVAAAIDVDAGRADYRVAPKTSPPPRA